MKSLKRCALARHVECVYLIWYLSCCVLDQGNDIRGSAVIFKSFSLQQNTHGAL